MKNQWDRELVNIGIGEDVTLADFARLVATVTGYRGEISFDPSRPDGTPRKLLDVSRLAKLGWRARTSLEEGIRFAYRSYTSESKQSAAGGSSGQGGCERRIFPERRRDRRYSRLPDVGVV